MSSRVSVFVYSDDSGLEQTPNGPRLHVINPQQVLKPAFVPGMFSFSITVGIVDLDTTVEHEIRLCFTDPQHEQLMDPITVSSPIGMDADLPQEARGFMMSVNARNVVFDQEGFHQTMVWLDNVLLGEFPVYVKGGSAQHEHIGS